MNASPPETSPLATAASAPEDPELIQTLRDHGAGRLVFGRFRLVRELGAGGMAVVWLAHDERLGLEAALKFLPGMVARDPEALHDLRREITRGLRLTHTGIVRLYDLHEDSSEGLAAIAMEYIDGLTLADEKTRQPDRCFDVAEPLLTWARTLCEVLAYVHEEAKVVHRDIKPRNLMLTSTGRLRVADFGIAATLCETHSRLTQDSRTSGTPLYMSPQQAMGRKPAAADDIYAIGATLYELLASKPPFFRGQVSVILHQVASETPPPIHQRREELGVTGRPPVPPAWEEAIAACLAKDPEDRPASVREVAARLGLASSTPVAPAVLRGAAPPPADETAPTLHLADSIPTAPSLPEVPAPTLPLSPAKSQPCRARVGLWAGTGALSILAVLAGYFLQPRKASPPLSAPLPMPMPPPSSLAIAGSAPAPRPASSPPPPSPLARATPPPVVLAAASPKPAATPDPARWATKTAPFINSLGLEFVPVPGTKILMCRTHARVRDFRAYARESGYQASGGAWVFRNKGGPKGSPTTERELDPNASWEAPGFMQRPEFPVVCINWNEAQAFCAWLSHKEGRQYRLPTDAEWSAAVGPAKYPWGNGWPAPSGAGNFLGVTPAKGAPAAGHGHADFAAHTSPVGSFQENRLGLFDMSGNASQWCEDEFRSEMNDPDVQKAHPNFRADRGVPGSMPPRVLRGGSWRSDEEFMLRSSHRAPGFPAIHRDDHGFRCVLVLPGA